MRIVMPLFQFDYNGEDFVFSEGHLAIRQFSAHEEMPQCDLFSLQDLAYIKQERYALVADGEELSDYKSNVNLLLIAFRLLSVGHSPFIKYRLSPDISSCSRLNGAFTQIDSPGTVPTEIDRAYCAICEADCNSPRLHNAFYFLYLGFHAIGWIESFLFLMSSLEALFSKDSKGGATTTICRRASRIINDPSICTNQDLASLYDTRSRIVHGDIRASDDSTDNLRLLQRMESITISCFKKLIETNGFRHFVTKSERDRYLSTLD
jgi:hypothetical protein